MNTTCASSGSLTPNPAELICNERPSDGEGQLSVGSHRIAAFILLPLEVITMYVFMLLIFKMVFVGHDFHISFQKAIGVVCNSACSAACNVLRLSRGRFRRIIQERETVAVQRRACRE